MEMMRKANTTTNGMKEVRAKKEPLVDEIGFNKRVKAIVRKFKNDEYKKAGEGIELKETANSVINELKTKLNNLNPNGPNWEGIMDMSKLEVIKMAKELGLSGGVLFVYMNYAGSTGHRDAKDGILSQIGEDIGKTKLIIEAMREIKDERMIKLLSPLICELKNIARHNGKEKEKMAEAIKDIVLFIGERFDLSDGIYEEAADLIKICISKGNEYALDLAEKIIDNEIPVAYNGDGDERRVSLKNELIIETVSSALKKIAQNENVMRNLDVSIRQRIFKIVESIDPSMNDGENIGYINLE